MKIASQCVCCNHTELSSVSAILMPFVAERVFGWYPVEVTGDWGLRDLKCGQVYSICNTLKCNDCGLVFLDIRFDEEELQALYFSYRDSAYNQLRDKYEPEYTKHHQKGIEDGYFHLNMIESYILSYMEMPAKILDWGGDTGVNTPFNGKVSEHHVFDISNKPVIDDALLVSKADASHHRYDLITLMHVLEHIPYPQDVLNEIVSIMREDTILYIELPYEDLMQSSFNLTSDIIAYKNKRHWHEHINFFSEKSIRELLRKCSLSLISLSVFEISDKSYIYSIICRLYSLEGGSF